MANKVDIPADMRSPMNYQMAAEAVIQIVDMATKFVPKTHPLYQAMRVFVKNGAPVVRKIAEVAPVVVPVVAPAVKKAADRAVKVLPDAASASAEKVADTAKGAGKAAAGAAGAVADAARNRVDRKEQEKARKAARKALLDGAGSHISAMHFMEDWDIQSKMDGYIKYSGCYAIAVYDKPVKKGDFSSFRDIYIGKSENMGKSIHADFIGLGNPDVYADVKYKQNVYVLYYPSPVDKLDELEVSLITALDADLSYNKSIVNK